MLLIFLYSKKSPQSLFSDISWDFHSLPSLPLSLIDASIVRYLSKGEERVWGKVNWSYIKHYHLHTLVYFRPPCPSKKQNKNICLRFLQVDSLHLTWTLLSHHFISGSGYSVTYQKEKIESDERRTYLILVMTRSAWSDTYRKGKRET